MNQNNLKIIRDYLLGWLIASLIWQLLWTTDRVQENALEATFNGRVTVFLLGWLFQGIGFSILHLFIDRYIKGRVLFIKLVAYTLTLQLFTGITLITSIFYLLRLIEIIGPEASFSRFIEQIIVRVAIIYALLVNFSIVLFIYINRMLGKGNLWRMITGKFYTPRVEEMIFMFLDLRGSTTIAEELGHVTYSRLIQDCFYDLAVVHDFKAEIYQYVGDEAVLVWRAQEGLESNNCILTFYAFLDQINSRSDYYKANYNMVPEFKAGVNMGKVTVTEVGEYKREIAYHGDAINTAARIQGQCNRLGSNLLISEIVLNSLKLDEYISADLKGEMKLRGKIESINIYSIEKKSYEPV
ncbi:MAG: adenylate/guanylate cyclase domain-containing protein [Bacteroidota bacterium]